MLLVVAVVPRSFLFCTEATFLVATSAKHPGRTFPTSRRRNIMAYSYPMQSPSMWWKSAYAMFMFVLFMSITSGIIVNPSAGAIIDPSQSAKYKKKREIDHRKSAKTRILSPSSM